MRKITVELVIIALIWIAVVISYLVCRMYDAGYLVAVAGLIAISVLYWRSQHFSLLLLVLFLFLAVFNVIRFTIAFNLLIWMFNVFPLVLLIVLIARRRKKLMELKAQLWD